MPAYNSADFIGVAIESILAQSFKDFEFVIINDGSTDCTPEIISQYAQSDNRIRFINNKENHGLISVLNQGLDLCRGEYIARMDSDDISLPQRFEKQIAYLDAHPDVGVLGTAGQNFDNDTKAHHNSANVDVIELLRGVGFYHPSVMLRRSVLLAHNIRYNPSFYLVEDLDLWTQLVKVTKMRNLQEVLLKYRVHKSSVSVKNKRLQEKNKEIVRQNMLNTISESVIVQNCLLELAGKSQTKPPSKTFLLFGIIPLLTIHHMSIHKIKISLLGCLPLFRIKNNKFYIAKIPVGRFFVQNRQNRVFEQI